MVESDNKKKVSYRTPLFEKAVAAGAKSIDFSGWEMPIQYQGIKQEHQIIRTSVGMFDISHMGKFALTGQDLLRQLQILVPSDLEKLRPGQAQYTVLLNHSAGIIDDIIFYYQGKDQLGKEKGLAIVNAATTAKDKTWLLENLQSTAIELEDLSSQQVLIAIQGPLALKSLQTFVNRDLNAIAAFGHIETEIFESKAFIARTGYTGEDGFEVMLDPETGIQLWEALEKAGVTPCGLGARDTLRLEAGMCLYGQDIDETTTPLEAGLSWLIHWDTKGDFIGRSQLEQQKEAGIGKKLVGIEMAGRYIARQGYKVFLAGSHVGNITSGTLSPTLGKAIALAYVAKSASKIGQEVFVEIRGKNYPAKIVKKPFYSREKK
ncbi:MAG: glycine cleavage system aminomethyltransferase GcvT [Prochloraceae cyanobacterium]|nr:glycine cleavage system aminomethyltransferase GcvT [Prochloraceae cyanobacterium]